jgi:hypothetical protein
MAHGFNAFTRPIEGIRSKSSLGGAITLLAASFALILFLSQMLMYIQVDITHSLDLAPSLLFNAVIPTEGGVTKKLFPNKRKAKMSPSDIQYLNAVQRNSIKVFIHVTFPKLNCKVLDYSHNGLKFSTGEYQKVNGPSKLNKRKPTEYDYAQATGGSTKGKSRKNLTSEPGSEDSCTVKGTLTIPRLAGDLNIFMSQETFSEIGQLVQLGIPLDQTDAKTGGHNVSHYIHEIRFGDSTSSIDNPLKDIFYVPDGLDAHNRPVEGVGIGLNQMSVKLVPTRYKRFGRRPKDAYQVSLTNYKIQPRYLVQVMVSAPGRILPGIAIHYDFDPLQVTQLEQRENIFVFLSSLIGIVGGVFVSVGLVSRLLMNTAKIVKKID